MRKQKWSNKCNRVNHEGVIVCQYILCKCVPVTRCNYWCSPGYDTSPARYDTSPAKYDTSPAKYDPAADDSCAGTIVHERPRYWLLEHISKLCYFLMRLISGSSFLHINLIFRERVISDDIRLHRFSFSFAHAPP